MNRFLLVITAAMLCIQSSSSANLIGRTLCGPGDKQPPTRKDTTEILESVRNEMRKIQINGTTLAGYIVFSTDYHWTEYLLVSDYDKRIPFLTGFEGIGWAFVTMTGAAVVTSSVYRQPADNAIDCNWSLMKLEPTEIGDWFEMAVGPEGKYVGIDKRLFNNGSFLWFEEILSNLTNRLELTYDTRNPVDEVWNAEKYNRPLQPANPINVHDLKFAGVTWQTKVANLRSSIRARGAGAFVVTALDEIAWLFNLRGSDVNYAPYFYAYAIVELENISLFIADKNRRLQEEQTDSGTKKKLYEHLGTDESGNAFGVPKLQVLDYDHESVESILKELSQTTKIWRTPDANYGIAFSIQDNFIVGESPIEMAKSVKNPQERVGMRNANIRDSAGLIQFLAFLDKEIKSGEKWTEFAAVVELTKRRLQIKYNQGLSFDTSAGYGSNGASFHYRATNGTDRIISTDSFFLLDSGGQYLDGTTDITRTLHYGQATDYQKECYTRVLMAKINIATAKWPEDVNAYEIDALTYQQLWEVGLDFDHGTGHGIGAYLGVHEGPGSISYRYHYRPTTLRINEFYALEPGYYEEGQFGIRLENTFTVVPFTPKYQTSNISFLQFDPVTFVPYETNLIQYNLLNQRQVDWLNEYNSNITKYILPLLGNDSVAIDWLNARTKPYNTSSTTNTDRTANITISGKLDLNMKVDL